MSWTSTLVNHFPLSLPFLWFESQVWRSFQCHPTKPPYSTSYASLPLHPLHPHLARYCASYPAFTIFISNTLCQSFVKTAIEAKQLPKLIPTTDGSVETTEASALSFKVMCIDIGGWNWGGRVIISLAKAQLQSQMADVPTPRHVDAIPNLLQSRLTVVLPTLVA